MAGSFRLEIVTPEKVVYDDQVTALQAPGVDGYFGILYNRAPLIAALGAGQVKFTELGGGQRFVAISGGFFEIRDNHAVLLADSAEFAEDIDAAEAQTRLERARLELTGLIPSELELERRRAALRVADVRVKVASRVHA